jgi:SsrA-binding protein
MSHKSANSSANSAGKVRPVGVKVLIARNRRASFDYILEQQFEAGLVLVGSEVKSLRAGKVDLSDAFGAIERGEIWLKQATIAQLPQATAFPHEPRRSRKCLLGRSEIQTLEKALARGGNTLVPVEMYFKDNRVKLVLALGKGKKNYDKRADMVKKTADREARSEIARGRKGH